MPISAIGSSIKLARTGLAALEMKFLFELLGEVAYCTAQPYINRALAGQITTLEAETLQLARSISATFIPDCDYNAQARGFYSLIADISDRKTNRRRIKTK